MAAQGYPSTDRDRVQRVRDVLHDPRQRTVLADLANLGGDHTSLDTLVDRTVDRVPAEREQVVNDLHHIHLPKLAELGVITYDAERRRITHHTWRVVDVLALASEALEGPDG